MVAELLKKSRKLVCKFGSGILTDGRNCINPVFFDRIAAQCAALVAQGKQIVIVSSGAQAAGLSKMNTWARKTDIHYRQALCAVGQVELMNSWRRAFDPHALQVAQLLLTREDFSHANRTLNMRNTLFTLIDEGIIPVINENDSVSVEEIKIGDNDTLAAKSAILWNADLLILFSDIDGVYEENPKHNPQAAFIGEVRDIERLRNQIAMEGTSSLGTGGIATKIKAAEYCFEQAIPTVVTQGKADAFEELMAGRQRATIFFPPDPKTRFGQ